MAAGGYWEGVGALVGRVGVAASCRQLTRAGVCWGCAAGLEGLRAKGRSRGSSSHVRALWDAGAGGSCIGVLHSVPLVWCNAAVLLQALPGRLRGCCRAGRVWPCGRAVCSSPGRLLAPTAGVGVPTTPTARIGILTAPAVGAWVPTAGRLAPARICSPTGRSIVRVGVGSRP